MIRLPHTIKDFFLILPIHIGGSNYPIAPRFRRPWFYIHPSAIGEKNQQQSWKRWMRNALATAVFFLRFSIGNLKLLLKKGISADWACGIMSAYCKVWSTYLLYKGWHDKKKIIQFTSYDQKRYLICQWSISKKYKQFQVQRKHAWFEIVPFVFAGLKTLKILKKLLKKTKFHHPWVDLTTFNAR